VSGLGVVLAGLLAGTAVTCLTARPASLARLARRPRPATGPPAGVGSRQAWWACAAAAAGALAVLPLPLGLGTAAVLLGAGPRALSRLEPASVRRERLRLLADLPLLLDLLAACLAGGAGLQAAALAVGEAVPGPAGARLRQVAAALQIGTPPGAAWLALAGSDPDDDVLGPAARTLARAADSGAPVAATLARLGAEARAESRAAGQEAARRAGVLVVAPLGLCFLPAFVLLGVVPVVIGLAGPLLTAP
jgi:pilus assembly protein TadC